MSDHPPLQTASLKEWDDANISSFHWKIMFVSGMGFFTDAYDLFIIGVAMALIKAQWHPSTVEVGLVTSTALLASAIGALIFGRIADLLGRKRIYGFEVLVLAGGAIACACSPGIIWLISFRAILGLGIGGDYPVSATIMSEYAGKCTRGMLVSMVFAMQAAGLIIGPLVAAGLLATHMSHNIAWRIMLALGAVPAMAVYWMRRHIKETPRFTLAHKGEGQLDNEYGNGSPDASTSRNTSQPHGLLAGIHELARNRRILVSLIGASLAWFLMDFAYYGNTVSSPLVLGRIAAHRSLLHDTLLQLLIFAVAAAPGYFVAAWTMDRFGRKLIQAIGFALMAVSFGAIALVPHLTQHLWPFLIVFGISYFFTEFGPNATTFIYPSELFPVRVRTTGHGIASAAGKLGAFVGVFLFPLLLHSHGLPGAELSAASVSVLGFIVTLLMLPETKGHSLEEISGESLTPGLEPAGAQNEGQLVASGSSH